MAYWNSPQGTRDEEFVSPFRATAPPGKRKYLTFEPDGVSRVIVVDLVFHEKVVFLICIIL